MESNYQVRRMSNAAAAVQADSLPLARVDPDGRSGWLYQKNSGDQKFNYYFYSGAYENMMMKRISSIYFVGSIDEWTNQQSELPFFVVYTKMKMDGTDAGSWYHSKHVYALHKDSQLVRPGEKCVFYALDMPHKAECVHGHRQLSFMTRIDDGEYDPDDEVLTVSLQSDSAAAQCSVYIENMGMEMDSFGRRVGDSLIDMKLIGITMTPRITHDA